MVKLRSERSGILQFGYSNSFTVTATDIDRYAKYRLLVKRGPIKAILKKFDTVYRKAFQRERISSNPKSKIYSKGVWVTADVADPN